VLIIGLTGGIGSGKTAVSDRFVHLGVPIIDTDILAREVVAPGRSALREIVAQFGAQCLNADGTLNRGYLRQQVFANPGLRERLESTIHPRIREAARRRLESIQAPYCIVVIPLLVETGMNDLVHRILVVDVPEDVQVKRVMARDGVSEEQVRHILAAQASRQRRLDHADDILENSGDLAKLAADVANLHQYYLELASEKFFD
jgi:dephospho-CoA kinase